jgi:exopolysaccharide biosynthesis polyprenyl glycosylphosphotransferase
MKKRHSIAIILYLLIDLLLAQWALDLALYFRFGAKIAQPWLVTLTPFFRLIIAIAWAFFALLFSVYSVRRAQGLLTELKALGFSIAASLGVLAAAIFLLDYDEFSRLLYVYFAVVDSFLLFNAHLIIGVLSAVFRWEGKQRVLIVGVGGRSVEVARALSEQRSRHWEVIGFLGSDPGEEAISPGDWPILGPVDAVLEVLSQHQVDEVILALPFEARKQLGRAYRRLLDQPVQVRLIPDALDEILAHAIIDDINGIRLLTLREPPLKTLDSLAKRLFDLAASLMLVILLAPLMLLIAVAIKLDSPGPVIFKQKRVGKNGKLFTFYKFRSMVHNADPSAHCKHMHRIINGEIGQDEIEGRRRGSLKMTDDARITQVGRFLRKGSLDELPQFFNVLKGEMSLVGPRPPIPYELEDYEEWHLCRLEALPGITGLWQVTARNQVSFEEMVRLDVEYIEKRSLWLDLKILLMTPKAVILGKGAG